MFHRTGLRLQFWSFSSLVCVEHFLCPERLQTDPARHFPLRLWPFVISPAQFGPLYPLPNYPIFCDLNISLLLESPKVPVSFCSSPFRLVIQASKETSVTMQTWTCPLLLSVHLLVVSGQLLFVSLFSVSL